MRTVAAADAPDGGRMKAASSGTRSSRARLLVAVLAPALALSGLAAVSPPPTDSGAAHAAPLALAGETQKPTLPWNSTSVPTVRLEGGPASGWQVTAVPGPWDPTPDRFSYQWFRNGALLDHEVFSSYRVGLADGGSSFTVRVIAHRVGYPELPKVSAPVVIPKPPYPFINAPTPSITPDGSAGAVVVGTTLEAALGDWEPLAYVYERQWLRGGEAIDGATGSRYTLVEADRGARISFRVRATKPDYQPTERVSRVLQVATGEEPGPGPGPKPTPAPVLKRFTATPKPKTVVLGGGTAKVGKKLAVKAGSWKPAKVTLKYQWLRNGKAIKGATKSKYRIAKKDRGKRISVRVTGKKTGYVATARTSSAKFVRKR